METIIVEASTDYHFGTNWAISNPEAQLDVRKFKQYTCNSLFVFFETIAFLRLA
jgi:hypothetical protein